MQSAWRWDADPVGALEQLKTLFLIKPGSLGDVVHALPCAAALKSYLPEFRLVWLVDERWESLLTDNPAVDATVVFPRQRFAGLTGFFRAIPWALGLKSLQPDIALDLQGLLRSALMARLSRPRRIVGLADAREGATWFYQEAAEVQAGEHSVLRYLRTLEVLGLPRIAKPIFPLPASVPPPVRLQEGHFILLHPFARGEKKSLSQAHVAQFCRAVQPMPVVLAGFGEMRAEIPGNTTNLLNRTNIRQLIWLVSAAACVVSVDSGPMHIAAAANPGLLSIHTWSDPRLVGPFNEQAWIWQGGEIRRQNLHAPSLPPARSPQDADMLKMAEFAARIAENRAALP